MDIRDLSFRIKSCIACNENQCPVIRERLDQHVLSHQSASRPSEGSDSYQHVEPSQSVCNEDECPAMKERLEHHVLSHHSNFRSSVVNQHVGDRKSSGTNTTITPSITPSVAIINSDEQTSTADLAVEELDPLSNPSYKEAVEREILVWAEELPKYPHPSAENLKQNIVNELIEKVDNLKADVIENNYDMKLYNEVSKFLYSLPPNPYVKKRDSSLDILKLKLINKICELNKQMINKTLNTNNNVVRRNENWKRPTDKNNSNLPQFNNNNNHFRNNKTPYGNYFGSNHTKTIGTNTSQDAFNDRYMAFYRPDDNIQTKNPNDKKLVDAQLQKSFQHMRPYYGQIYGQPNLKNNKQHKTEIKEDVCKEKISTWLIRVIQKSERNIEQNDKKILTDVLFNRLKPLLGKKINSPRYKSLLKAEILNFLYDYFMVAVATNGTYFNKLVESLAITLLIEKTNSEAPRSGSNTKYSYYCIDQGISYKVDTESYYKPIVYKIVTNALETVTTYPENVENDITELLLNNMDRLRSGLYEDIKDDLFVLLKSSTDLYNVTIGNIVNVIMDQLTNILCDSIDKDNSIQTDEILPWSHTLSVYKSEQELRGRGKVSKTSLQRHSDVIKRSEPKINTEEKAYMERITALIAAWVKTLPKKRNKAEDLIVKETIINSLAIDIMDQVKLEAAAPEAWSEKEKYFSFFIYRWLNRFEYFDDIKEAKPYVDKLMRKLTDVPLPAHGNRQIKKINKFMKMTSCSQATLPPEDILEDEISIVINAQPSKIFNNADKEIRNKQVHEFALNIQKSSEDESIDITKEIIQWLKKLIKSEEKDKFHSLKEQLTERIKSLLQEKTSTYNDKDRIPHRKKEIQHEKVTSPCCELNVGDIYESENVFKECVAKYIEHNYDVENSVAREAFGEILKVELQKINAPITNEHYDNFTKNKQFVLSTRESLSRELKYINIISDWLKTLPLPATFNRTENRSRVEFVTCLAKNLSEVDESRIIHLTGMEYKVYLTAIINKYADRLPIPTYYKRNMTAMVDDLVQKIVEVRPRPCCQIANCKKNRSSISNINIPDEQLSRFIEEYIRENHEELSEDELKLEAVSARLFKEIDKLKSKNPELSNVDEIEEIDDPVRRLSFKLDYAKEITDCLNNLPLLPMLDKASRDSRVKMISNLARKMYERWQALYDDPNNTYVNTILSEYIMQWISELPLDTSKEIDEAIVIQQLLNRMERVNKQKLERQKLSQTNQINHSRELCKLPHTCCNKSNASHINHEPGAAIVEAIENWCAELPVQTEDETNNNAIKNHIATNLFKKVSELNMNPKYFTDNNLYRQLLSEEIDEQLGNLPHNSTFQTSIEDLKEQLVSRIMEKRFEIREQASGTEYKQELEKTIKLSLPNPIKTYEEDSSGFKIYKDRLATMFILDNFDYGNDEAKENYEKRIKKEIDKYFQDAQNRNAIPLTKDQMYNELYSALFNVPLPNEASIVEEVEEIKTRCEIDNWFETLPLRTASCDGEVLVRDQIIAMLAKRIHRMEKYEHNPDSKIYKEIVKWLLKLPLLPGQEDNVDELARKLQQRLKSTSKNRKCTRRNESVYIDKFITLKNKKKGKGLLGTSQIAGPSSENKAWPCPASPTCCQVSPPKPSNPADIIMNIVEMWCQQLPLQVNSPLDRDSIEAIKNNIIIKVIMKISELNVNPETLNNDLLYDALLDEELENLLSTLPTSKEFNQSKQLRKNQLKDAIKSVKPLILKEKAKYEYKQELQNIVDIFLREPQNLTPKIKALYVSLKEDIINNFILHYYHKDDEEGRFYKMMINIAVEKYFTEVCQNNNTLYNPLMVGNHLISEMAKVPVPSKAAILEEIREIRLKFEITEFFNNHSLCNRNDKLLMRNQIISTLAKRISELGKDSNTSENFNKIKNEIVKFLKKLDENVEQENINSLVQSLQNLPQTETYGASESRYVSPLPFTDDDQRYNQNIHTPIEHQRLPKYNEEDNQNTEDGQWMSLLSVTPKTNDVTNMTHLDKTNLGDKERSRFSGQVVDSSLREFKIDYSDFQKGVELTSSNQEFINDEKTKLESNQKTGCKSTFMGKRDVADQSGPTAPGQVVTSLTPKLLPKLSEQDSTFVRDINMQKSNSADTSYKAANDQQSIPPSVLTSPRRPPYYQQNRSDERRHIENQIPSDSSSMTDNTITQFPHYKLNQSSQYENLRQPVDTTTYHKVSEPATQQDPQKVTQKAQLSSHINQSYAFDRSMHTDFKSPSRKETTKPNKIKSSISSTDNEEKDRFPNLSSSISIRKSSKTSAPFRSIREPSPISIPPKSYSTSTFTPRRPILDSKVPCCKRRPSFFFFNPSQVISESSSCAQYTQTDENKCCTDLTLSKEDGCKDCMCGKRKRICRSEIPICRAHKKKRCELCNGLSPFYCKMPPCYYPGFYYY